MAAESPDSTSVVPAWGRFLLRLGAIAWPFLSFYFPGIFRGTSTADRPVPECTPLPLWLLMLVLSLPGTVTLVCAVNTTGRRQRVALAIAATIAAAWVVLAAVASVLAPGTTCDLGIS